MTGGVQRDRVTRSLKSPFNAAYTCLSFSSWRVIVPQIKDNSHSFTTSAAYVHKGESVV